MDRSVKPGDDFWAYVNGTWDKTTKIAADRASAGPFITLSDQAEKDVRADRRGPRQRHPLAATSASRSAIFTAATWTRRRSTPPAPRRSSPICEDRSGEDPRPAAEPVRQARLRQPGRRRDHPRLQGPGQIFGDRRPGDLGPSEPRILSTDDAKMAGHRAAYRNYIVTIEKLAGLPGGEAAADRIIALETALSKAQWPAAERRDIDKIYNPMSRAQLAKLAPQFAVEHDARQGRARRAPDGHRDRAVGGRRRRQDPRLDSAVDVEGMARVPLRLGSRELPAQGVR